MQIAAVILAAGAGRRFGGPKQTARLEGRTLLERVVDAGREAGLDPILAVVPSSIAVPADVVPVLNDEPERGISHSLRLGIGAVPVEADAAVVLLGDQPTTDPLTILELMEAATPEHPIVASEAGGVIAPPILVMRSAFSLVDEAAGDAGLRPILERRPELMRTLPVGEHAPDVDTRADLEALGERCPGCQELFLPVPGGATHDYLASVPGCWAVFGEILAREFGDPAYGRIHRHTVDVYAVQHPGIDGRRQRQSVALHLIGLCHWLEHGLTASQLNPITQALANEDRPWPWLTPPRSYRLSVLDVVKARTGLEHGQLVRRWAQSVWEAWAQHHDTVRRWAADALVVER